VVRGTEDKNMSNAGPWAIDCAEYCRANPVSHASRMVGRDPGRLARWP